MYVNKRIKDRTAVSAFEVGKMCNTDKNIGGTVQQMEGFERQQQDATLMLVSCSPNTTYNIRRILAF
jgi:hypothetical protein